MKTKFVRILSVLLAIAMLAACSVIVSATGTSTSSVDALSLSANYDKSSKIVKISLVYSGEVCYNVEGNWGAILDEDGNTADGFTLNKVSFEESTVVDGLNDMYVGNKGTGDAMWVDMKFDNTATSGTIMTAEYTVDTSKVQPGTYKAEFNVAVYTGSDLTPQEGANGWLKTLTVPVTIECDHKYDNACDAECNVCGDGRTPADHVYTDAKDTTCNECGAEREVEPDEPQGTLKGDVNLDGQVTLIDAVQLTRHLLEVEIITNEVSLINANVNGDDEISLADAVKLTRYTLDLETLD